MQPIVAATVLLNYLITAALTLKHKQLITAIFQAHMVFWNSSKTEMI